jgi:putative ATPase
MPTPAAQSSLFQPPESAKPLAARMRPRTLEEVAGQQHLLEHGKALRVAIESGAPGSMIFWGPPGSGKTTLALLIAHYTDRHFVPFSAVIEGVPRVREIIKEAEQRLAEHQRGTILFVDEIHRLNTAQQDAFLPHVERGTIRRASCPNLGRRSRRRRPDRRTRRLVAAAA